MQNKYLILAAVIALVLVVAGCTKVQPPQTTGPVVAPVTDTSLGEVSGGIAETDVLTEEVQVEPIDINPDELSALDF